MTLREIICKKMSVVPLHSLALFITKFSHNYDFEKQEFKSRLKINLKLQTETAIVAV